MRLSPKQLAILRWVLLTIAGSATAFAAFVAVENWRGQRAWRETVAQLTAKGESLSFAALRPAPVRDHENFFKAPLLSRVLYEQPGDAERQKIVSALPLSAVHEFQRFGIERKDYATLREQLNRQHLLDVPTSENAAADILAAMSPFRPVLDELRDAGRHRPKAALDWDDVPMGFHRVAADTIHRISVALGFRARLEVELGLIEDAFADLVALQRLGNALAGPPANLLHLMLGLSMHGVAAEIVSEGCRRQVWSDRHLERFQALLDKFTPVAGFRDAIRCERAAVVYFVDNPPEIPAFGVDWPWWLFPGWAQQNKVTYCRTLEERIIVRLRPATERILPRTTAASSGTALLRQEIPGLPFGWLTRLCMAHLEGILDNFGVTTERLKLTSAAWASERFRLANRAYPGDFSAMVPRYLASHPVGILNGLPVVLKKSATGSLQVCSAGWDAVDDGGAKDDVVVSFRD